MAIDQAALQKEFGQHQYNRVQLNPPLLMPFDEVTSHIRGAVVTQATLDRPGIRVSYPWDSRAILVFSGLNEFKECSEIWSEYPPKELALALSDARRDATGAWMHISKALHGTALQLPSTKPLEKEAYDAWLAPHFRTTATGRAPAI